MAWIEPSTPPPRRTFPELRNWQRMGMHDAVFRAVGSDGIAALLRLSRSDLRHGDMCLPNILADLSTGRLSGIVDWRDAGRFDHIVDVASTIWTCGYNRHSAEVPPIVLSLIGWARADRSEVRRLESLWTDLAGPADPSFG